MAMTKCKECDKEVSTNAKSCPHCGVENPGVTFLDSIIGFIFIGIIGWIIYLFAFDSNKIEHIKTSIPQQTKEEIRKKEIEKNFSRWDGSLPELTKVIKKSMNDPSSYEHVKTIYWDEKDYLIVKTTFRGKNAFGGIVKNWIKAKVDLSGNVIEIISQGR